MTDATARRAANAAMQALLDRRLDPNEYEAGVGACYGKYIVDFVQRGARLNENETGNPGKIPGITVVLSGETFKIVTTGLIR